MLFTALSLSWAAGWLAANPLNGSCIVHNDHVNRSVYGLMIVPGGIVNNKPNGPFCKRYVGSLENPDN